MRPAPGFPTRAAVALLLATAAAAPAHAKVADSVRVDDKTWVDHDARPVGQPAEREKPLYAHEFREAIVEPISHGFDIPDKLLWLGRLGGSSKGQSANVNAFDEVANSSWFTNRNHVRALTPGQVRLGPLGEDVRPAPPYVVKSYKTSGVVPGFNIKDANGRRWVVKLDPVDHPQLGSGADVIVTRLLWAAGYNLPHDVSFAFRRDELQIDEELARGADGVVPLLGPDLDSLLTRGARGEDGRSYAQASLFLEGTPVGHIDMRERRPDDPNDLYTHLNRRELRGLYVLMSWVGSWDTKDHQSLDTFVATQDTTDADSLGWVRHHLLDLGASLGAAAEGAKAPIKGFENTIDWGWIGRRLLTFGFVAGPSHGVRQETGIPSVGNFEATAYHPDKFKPIQPHPAFCKRTDRDGYWGAKIVASFSDAQIEAAIDAVGYEDPRAKPALLALLKERRDKVARFWFDRMAPLDWFHVDGNVLRFHDLAVDRGLARPRHYTVRLASSDGERRDGAPDKGLVQETAVALDTIAGGARAIELELAVDDHGGEPAKVTLERQGDGWTITRVVHE